MNILLVDDDPVLLDCGKQLLNMLGHRVQCAENGKDALEILFEDDSFESVVLDMTMPIMSGRETLALIKKDFPNLHVVVCSGYSADDTFHETDEIRPDAILAKPFLLEDLKRALLRT
ncbi:MAG: response regulator [Pirellulaceae bacterium]|nr:response regulator [Pirellulaceae bacterium]